MITDRNITLMAKCLELASSDVDGEALAAARKADSLRRQMGLSWEQVVARSDLRATPYAASVSEPIVTPPAWQSADHRATPPAWENVGSADPDLTAAWLARQVERLQARVRTLEAERTEWQAAAMPQTQHSGDGFLQDTADVLAKERAAMQAVIDRERAEARAREDDLTRRLAATERKRAAVRGRFDAEKAVSRSAMEQLAQVEDQLVKANRAAEASQRERERLRDRCAALQDIQKETAAREVELRADLEALRRAHIINGVPMPQAVDATPESASMTQASQTASPINEATLATEELALTQLLDDGSDAQEVGAGGSAWVARLIAGAARIGQEAAAVAERPVRHLTSAASTVAKAGRPLPLAMIGGRCVLVDLAPLSDIATYPTLRRAQASLDYAAEAGAAYVLATPTGLTLTALMTTPINESTRMRFLEAIDAAGALDQAAYQALREQLALNTVMTAALLVQNDLMMVRGPFAISRLPGQESFDRLRAAAAGRSLPLDSRL